MEQELNKLNPSFVGVISTVHERFQNLFENVQIFNQYSNKQNTTQTFKFSYECLHSIDKLQHPIIDFSKRLHLKKEVIIFKSLRLYQSNKKQQYTRTMKRWYDPSYLSEFREVTTLTSLLSHQNFFSIKTTKSS